MFNQNVYMYTLKTIYSDNPSGSSETRKITVPHNNSEQLKRHTDQAVRDAIRTFMPNSKPIVESISQKDNKLMYRLSNGHYVTIYVSVSSLTDLSVPNVLDITLEGDF